MASEDYPYVMPKYRGSVISSFVPINESALLNDPIPLNQPNQSTSALALNATTDSRRIGISAQDFLPADVYSTVTIESSYKCDADCWKNNIVFLFCLFDSYN